MRAEIYVREDNLYDIVIVDQDGFPVSADTYDQEQYDNFHWAVYEPTLHFDSK